MAIKATTSHSTTDQTISQASSPDPSKIWRPVRPITVSDPTEDQIGQLRGRINQITSSLSSLGVTVSDNQASSPIASGNLPGQVTAVSASVTAKNIGGVLMAVIDVNFTPGVNFAKAQLWATGYNGISTPQLLTEGFSSPIEYAAQITGELVTLRVVAVNSAGVAASFSSAPTVTVVLNGSSTAPPAPTINQALVAMSGGTGWQFSFNVINGLLADVISGYWIYRSSTHTTPTGTSQRFQWVPRPPSTLPYTFQDIVSGTYYYWVSAVSVSGLESSLTDATATTRTSFDYPTTQNNPIGSPFANPTYAYDGNEATFASASVTSPAGTGGSVTAEEVWSSFTAAPTGVTITDFTLQVLSYAAVDNKGVIKLEYSTDNGSTWSSFYTINVIDGGNATKQYYTATLSLSQDLTQVQVRGTCVAISYLPTGGDPAAPADWVQATAVQNLYECRIAITYH